MPNQELQPTHLPSLRYGSFPVNLSVRHIMNTRMLIRILFGVPAIVLGVPLIVLGLITELTRPLSIMGAFGLIGFFRWTNPEKYLKSRSDLVHVLLFISFGLIAILDRKSVV